LSPRSRSGRVRGRPGPRRGMRISVSAAPSMMVSLTLPLVSDRQRHAPAVADQVQFAAEATPGTTQGVTAGGSGTTAPNPLRGPAGR
jgi:hypothetical protein